MVDKDLEDLKLKFVTNVFEVLTKQIQHLDIKTSVILSWDGVIAVMLGRELIIIFNSKIINIWIILLCIMVAITLVISGIFVYNVLKPREGSANDISFAGLLWASDILKLGKNPKERIANYLDELILINDHGKLYTQFIKSIVLISEIYTKKNKMFINSLIFTAISFTSLIVLIALIGITISGKHL